MKVTKENFNSFHDGTIFTLFLQGDDWEKDIGEIYQTIKIGNNLFVIDETKSFFDINEIDEENYEFSLSVDKVQNNFFKRNRGSNNECCI